MHARTLLPPLRTRIQEQRALRIVRWSRTCATLRPMGAGLWGVRVASTPILRPSNRGTRILALKPVGAGALMSVPDKALAMTLGMSAAGVRSGMITVEQAALQGSSMSHAASWHAWLGPSD